MLTRCGNILFPAINDFILQVEMIPNLVRLGEKLVIFVYVCRKSLDS